jgi:threonine dehydratase
MPTISTPSKIAATKGYGAEVIFSGSTSEERESVVRDVMERTGAVLVPPYDHPDIILGQGTMALEFEKQVTEMLTIRQQGEGISGVNGADQAQHRPRIGLDAVIAPCGGGGMLSGVATALQGTGIQVFGAEPNVNGTDDAVQGLKSGKRVTSVKTLTIADGLRTPVGQIPWTVISDKEKVKGVFGVSEEQIKAAMKLVLERMKVFIEPSAAVGVATALYHEGFRKLVEREAGQDGWNVGVILSGGNTTLEAISKLFAVDERRAEREESLLGARGERMAENVAG